MPQRAATIESLPMAFEVVKGMQADGLKWSEGYRPNRPAAGSSPMSVVGPTGDGCGLGRTRDRHGLGETRSRTLHRSGKSCRRARSHGQCR